MTHCDYSIDVDCACGQTHRLPIDASGHYSGPLPCDPAKHVELQVNPAEWRQTVEREQAEVKH